MSSFITKINKTTIPHSFNCLIQLFEHATKKYKYIYRKAFKNPFLTDLKEKEKKEG